MCLSFVDRVYRRNGGEWERNPEFTEPVLGIVWKGFLQGDDSRLATPYGDATKRYQIGTSYLDPNDQDLFGHKGTQTAIYRTGYHFCLERDQVWIGDVVVPCLVADVTAMGKPAFSAFASADHTEGAARMMYLLTPAEYADLTTDHRPLSISDDGVLVAADTLEPLPVEAWGPRPYSAYGIIASNHKVFQALQTMQSSLAAVLADVFDAEMMKAPSRAVPRAPLPVAVFCDEKRSLDQQSWKRMMKTLTGREFSDADLDVARQIASQSSLRAEDVLNRQTHVFLSGRGGGKTLMASMLSHAKLVDSANSNAQQAIRSFSKSIKSWLRTQHEVASYNAILSQMSITNGPDGGIVIDYQVKQLVPKQEKDDSQFMRASRQRRRARAI